MKKNKLNEILISGMHFWGCENWSEQQLPEQKNCKVAIHRITTIDLLADIEVFEILLTQ